MRKNLDWEPYLEARKKNFPYRDRLAAYGRIARRILDADRFEEFCTDHLAHLDEVVWEFFGTEEAKEAVRAKVALLYPVAEVESFTEHFWGLIQQWRKDQEGSHS